MYASIHIILLECNCSLVIDHYINYAYLEICRSISLSWIIFHKNICGINKKNIKLLCNLQSTDLYVIMSQIIFTTEYYDCRWKSYLRLIFYSDGLKECNSTYVSAQLSFTESLITYVMLCYLLKIADRKQIIPSPYDHLFVSKTSNNTWFQLNIDCSIMICMLSTDDSKLSCSAHCLYQNLWW